MQNILQKLQPKTQESSSSFLEGTPEYTFIPASPEVRLHEKTQTRRQQIARSVRARIDVNPSQITAVVEHDRQIASAIIDAGRSIMQMREREIALDGGMSRRLTLAKRRESKISLAEVELGKKANEMMEKSLASFSVERTSDYHEKNASYMRRESEVGSRILGQKDMQFFCQDKNTWVWHVDTDDEQMTFLYHIRPDGVLKERIGGETTRISGDELNHFAHWTKTYYGEVQRTVYLAQPENTAGRYQAWDTPPVSSLSYN